MVDPANPETSVMNAVKQLQDDTQGYMDRVTNGEDVYKRQHLCQGKQSQ